MPLVIGAEIVAVNNADGVVEPQAVPEAQTAFGQNKKNPAFGYTRSDAVGTVTVSPGASSIGTGVKKS